jgi:hypothetical protein
MYWRGLETGERRALASLSIRSVPSHIHSIFTSILQYYIYPASKFAKMLFNLIIKKKNNGDPIVTLVVVLVRGVA